MVRINLQELLLVQEGPFCPDDPIRMQRIDSLELHSVCYKARQCVAL